MGGASYFCTERFVHHRSRKVSSVVMNVGRGTLDLRDLDQPIITGTWEQIKLPRKGLRWNMNQVASGEPPPPGTKRLTHGSFEFKRISCTYDPRPWQNPDLRAKVGLDRTTELYVVTPL